MSGRTLPVAEPHPGATVLLGELDPGRFEGDLDGCEVCSHRLCGSPLEVPESGD
jgi:hypothetical protein